jgi:hypothetical protein
MDKVKPGLKSVKCSYHYSCTGYFVGDHESKCAKKCAWNENIPIGERVNNWPRMAMEQEKKET